MEVVIIAVTVLVMMLIMMLLMVLMSLASMVQGVRLVLAARHKTEPMDCPQKGQRDSQIPPQGTP
jgi:hypothetical protein